MLPWLPFDTHFFYLICLKVRYLNRITENFAVPYNQEISSKSHNEQKSDCTKLLVLDGQTWQNFDLCTFCIPHNPKKDYFAQFTHLKVTLKPSYCTRDCHHH